ncbi:hypothetical protein F3Y22_tig00110384pilonHSYRG00693 [Hibiscus syriacus]|uniref:Uncharacterized protein n=1 Tax=Hibiscus syriacus TaxID=106335 RepID=A0A6A3ARR3_HIBSY|nr:hypothetical protein F3Y22_tig00110384pilonHSYRG00693 [Hibiscus syriacus]
MEDHHPFHFFNFPGPFLDHDDGLLMSHLLSQAQQQIWGLLASMHRRIPRSMRFSDYGNQKGEQNYEWLFSKSKAAIKELAENLPAALKHGCSTGGGKSVSSPLKAKWCQPPSVETIRESTRYRCKSLRVLSKSEKILVPLLKTNNSLMIVIHVNYSNNMTDSSGEYSAENCPVFQELGMSNEKIQYSYCTMTSIKDSRKKPYFISHVHYLRHRLPFRLPRNPVVASKFHNFS